MTYTECANAVACITDRGTGKAIRHTDAAYLQDYDWPQGSVDLSPRRLYPVATIHANAPTAPQTPRGSLVPPRMPPQTASRMLLPSAVKAPSATSSYSAWPQRAVVTTHQPPSTPTKTVVPPSSYSNREPAIPFPRSPRTYLFPEPVPTSTGAEQSGAKTPYADSRKGVGGGDVASLQKHLADNSLQKQPHPKSSPSTFPISREMHAWLRQGGQISEQELKYITDRVEAAALTLPAESERGAGSSQLGDKADTPRILRGRRRKSRLFGCFA